MLYVQDDMPPIYSFAYTCPHAKCNATQSNTLHTSNRCIPQCPPTQITHCPHFNTPQHIAAHCNTLQHTATRCNALHYTPYKHLSLPAHLNHTFPRPKHQTIKTFIRLTREGRIHTSDRIHLRCPPPSLSIHCFPPHCM